MWGRPIKAKDLPEFANSHRELYKLARGAYQVIKPLGSIDKMSFISRAIASGIAQEPCSCLVSGCGL